MKKGWKRIISMVLAAAFMLYLPCAEVSAASDDPVVWDETGDVEELDIVSYVLPDDYFADRPVPRTMLTNCFILVACEKQGIVVDIYTGATQTASVLGIKNIKVQKKEWYGWHTVASSSGCERKNCVSMGCSFVYSDAEYGATYRILCTHYGNVDEYIEGDNDSGAFVYKY